MDIKKLKKEELLKLKNDIDSQLNDIDSQLKESIEKSKEKNSLSDLVYGDKIFCIHFHESKIYNMAYVDIIFYKKLNNYVNFSSSHDELPIGCSSSVESECMNNYFFLSEFFSSNYYFFTMKPENWKTDIKTEMNRILKRKEKKYKNDIKEFKKGINCMIKNNEIEL